MSPSPTNREVVITAAEDSRADLDSLAQRLAAKGLADGSVLPNLGLITGHAAQHMLDGLRADPGVASVELGGEVQLPPPDSDVQ